MTASITWNVTDITAPSSADGVTTGNVWLTLGGTAFPEPGWWDLPVSVLSTAVKSYRELVDGQPDGELADGEAGTTSYFFEGSYYLAYRRLATDKTKVYIEANCDKDEDDPVSIVVGEVPLIDLRDALARAIEDVLGAIEGKPHTEEDVAIMQRKKAELSA